MTETAAVVPWVQRTMTRGAMTAITSLTFDCEQELLWLSDSYGNVRSFQPLVNAPNCELEWYAYTAFNYYRNSPCICVASTPDIVWTSGLDAIRAQKRGGGPVYSIPVPTAVQRRIFSICPDTRNNSVIFHGESAGIMQVFPAASTTNIAVTNLDAVLLTCMLLSDNHLITGSATGEVALRDRNTFAAAIKLRGDARVSDVLIDDSNTYVTVASQSVIKLFDVRQPAMAVAKVSAALPVAEMSRAAVGNKIMCLNSYGVEVFEPTDLSRVYSMTLAGGNPEHQHGHCTTLAVSRNGTCLVVGTDTGILNCLSHLSAVQVDEENGIVMGPYNNTDERKQPVQATPVISNKWKEEDEEPQIELGFDYTYKGDLASDWPPPHHMILAAEEKPLTVPQSLRDQFATPADNRYNVRRCDTFRSNPKDKLTHYIPNPYPFNELVGDDPTKVGPLLVHLRKQRKRGGNTRSNNLAYSKLEEASQNCYTLHAPFDWKSYNQSKDLIGLDNSLRESWVNPILHSLYYLQPPQYSVRKTIMRHLCRRRFCMTCELSSLFHNMSTQVLNYSVQPITQPTNLLRTLRQLPRFANHQVFAPISGRDEAVARCHMFVKLLLEQMDDEVRSTSESGDALGPIQSDYVAAVFGTELQLTQSKAPIAPRFFWEVPASASKVDEGLQHLLKQLERYRNESVSIRALPPVLLLLLNPEHGHLKPPPSLKFSRPNEEYNYYIASNVIHLAEDSEDAGNFVLHCKMPDPSVGVTKNTIADPWVVFNDYCVSGAVSSEDVLETLIPSTLTHATVVTCYVLDAFRGSRDRGRDDMPINHFNVAGDVLVDDWAPREYLAMREPGLPPPRPSRVLRPLTEPRHVNPNDIVALDAEYVLLDWGNEPRDEPTWFQHKQHMSLARISCILSTHETEERIIIDDYIATTEPVKDYVTQYSGIYENDLNPRKSPYALTSLKNSVLKLRCLLDRGVRFLGHGLSQDFRVINLAVPKHRCIDTVELFHRKGHRYLGLRFLAYHLLDEKVQEHEHDSIEDARTSLRLYRKYMELISAGLFESTLDFLLQRGADTNWYVPKNHESSTSDDEMAEMEAAAAAAHDASASATPIAVSPPLQTSDAAVPSATAGASMPEETTSTSSPPTTTTIE